MLRDGSEAVAVYLPAKEVVWIPPERRQGFNGRDWFEAGKAGG